MSDYQIPPEWRFHKRFEVLTSDDHPKKDYWRQWLKTHPAPGMPQPTPDPVKDYPRPTRAHEWQDDRVLVVSRYREQLHWLKDVKIPVIVYNKGPAIRERWDHVTIVQRPNRGRESETMLYHMVEHYDSLPPITIFSQGHPFDHCDPDFLDRLVHPYVVPTGLTTKYRDDAPPVSVKSRDLVEEHYGHEVRYGDALVQHHPTIERWFDVKAWDYLFDCHLPEHLWFSYGAMYAVPSSNITARPREFWAWLMSQTDDGATGSSFTEPPVNPWSLEALWRSLFDPSIPIKWPREVPRPVVKPTTRIMTPEERRAVVKAAMTTKRSGCGCGGGRK